MTRCAACASRGVDHDKIVQATRGSLYEFCHYFVSDWVSPNLHKPVWEWYSKERSGGAKYFLIMIPRGHLKTTAFNIGLCPWILVNNPSSRILVVMSSMRLAKEKVGRMEAILTSPEFKHFFGHLIPDASSTRWNKNEFEIVRPDTFEEPSVTALGSETKVTGGHYDIQILDDLIDATAENSEAQMQNAMDFLQMSSGLWVKRSNAHQIVIGTYTPGGFYERLLSSDRFAKVVLGCYVDDRYRQFMARLGYEVMADDGSPVFPENETEESLKDALESFGPTRFANQMLNMRADSTLVNFRRDDIQHFRWDDERHRACGIDEVWYPTKTLFRQLTIDPAGTTAKKSDESAIVVSGYARGSSVAFVLDSWSGRVVTSELIDKAIELAVKWEVNVIKCEFAAMQVVIGGFLRDALASRGLHFPVLPAKTGNKSKGVRIVQSIQPWVANHQIYFRQDQPALADELCSIVTDEKGQVCGRSPNLADALAYHAEFWRRTPLHLESEEDDIRYEDEEEQLTKVAVRYGLHCPTRRA